MDGGARTTLDQLNPYPARSSGTISERISDLAGMSELQCGARRPPQLWKTPSRALQELVYFGSNNACNAFTTFIDARQNAGCPVTLVRPSPDPAVL